jgi:hypothetical protein
MCACVCLQTSPLLGVGSKPAGGGEVIAAAGSPSCTIHVLTDCICLLALYDCIACRRIHVCVPGGCGYRHAAGE